MKKLVLLLSIVILSSCTSKEDKIKTLETDIEFATIMKQNTECKIKLYKKYLEASYKLGSLEFIDRKIYSTQDFKDSINSHVNLIDIYRREIIDKEDKLNKIKDKNKLLLLFEKI